MTQNFKKQRIYHFKTNNGKNKHFENGQILILKKCF